MSESGGLSQFHEVARPVAKGAKKLSDEEFVQASKRIGDLADQGKEEEAIAAIYEVLACDVSDIGKSIQCFNMAMLHRKLGKDDAVLYWYDRGIQFEPPHGRFYNAESKAAYLYEKGRWRESLDIYKELLANPHLGEDGRARVEANVRTLESKVN